MLWKKKKTKTERNRNLLHQWKNCKHANKNRIFFFIYFIYFFYFCCCCCSCENSMFKKMTKDDNPLLLQDGKSSAITTALPNAAVTSPCCNTFPKVWNIH